jgi:signal transduction histidine kinase
VHPLVRRYGLDVLIAAAAAESALELATRHDSARAPQVPLWFGVPAIALTILPLLLRRRYPFGAPLALWLAGSGLSFVDGRLVMFPVSVFVAAMGAAFLFGHLADPVLARLGLAVVVVGAALIVYHDPRANAGEIVFVPVLFMIGWLAGFSLRERATAAEAAEERATHAEREREAAARVAVAEERARIARELHDIVAHAVSIMVLHVGAVRHKLPDTLVEETGALRGVERTGRSALTEMRRLLGAMRRDGEDAELAPQPGLDNLDALLAEIGRAGLPVRLHIDGESFPLPPAVDLSAYRIVQEGLTNALKHGPASRADVTVRYRPDDLTIEVRDDGPGSPSGDGAGHGLVGIRERVKIYGGEMNAGPVQGQGFVLRTRLPLPSEDQR